MTNENSKSAKTYHVGLFITCLVDLFRPSIGFACIKLLQDAGCTVDVPASQTCCGQPAMNSGDKKTTQDIAKQVIEAFQGFDYIIAPSGSCAGTLKIHYPELLTEDPVWSQKAKSFSEKVYELTSFLSDVMNYEGSSRQFDRTITYHDSCAGLRELNIKQQPRKLLQSIKGLSIQELEDAEVCCGFGGTFCVKYPDISNAILERKADKILASQADILLAGDLGCLMNMAGKLSKDKNTSIEVRHIAEVLADMTDQPAITKSTKS